MTKEFNFHLNKYQGKILIRSRINIDTFFHYLSLPLLSCDNVVGMCVCNPVRGRELLFTALFVQAIQAIQEIRLQEDPPQSKGTMQSSQQAPAASASIQSGRGRS